jgi:hypothetical protein
MAGPQHDLHADTVTVLTTTPAMARIVWAAALILLGAALVFLKRRSRRSAPGSDHE